MPCICLCSLALLSMAERPSAHKRNKYKDNRSPYLIPLVGFIRSLGSPFMRTEYEAKWIVSIISATHLSSNANRSIIFLKNCHYTRSYALLISNFTAIWPSLPLCLFLILWSNSKATVVLSVIIQSGMKALWASDITHGRISFKRLAMTFESRREITLPKQMGRKSPKEVGSFFFGSKTMWV